MTKDNETVNSGPKFMAKPDDARPKPKRFYKEVKVIQAGDSHAIELDGRSVKTPMKNPLAVMTSTLAQAIAKEWQDQKEHIDHEAMALTKLANTAIDRVARRRKEIIDEIIAFAGSDLLCYRASDPQSLVNEEAENWDPVVNWFHEVHNIKMKTTSGIIHVAQEQPELTKFSKLLNEYDEFALTAIHNVTSLTGSALLSLGLFLDQWTSDEIWRIAHIDEDFQIKRWGEDQEAKARRQKRADDFKQAVEFYRLSKK